MQSLSGMTRSVLFALLLVVIEMGTRPALAQNGTPVPEDSPLVKSFTLLQAQPSYRMTMTMQSNDPRMAQAAAMGMGFSPIEKVVKGGTSQVVMHMKMPAMDMRGALDDWEIKAVAQDGRAARKFSSPAIPRLLKQSDQMAAMQLAMMDRQAGMAVAQALTQGPLGAISAAVIAGQTALAHVEIPRQLKKEKEFFEWKCVDQPGGAPAQRTPAQLTDMRSVGDQMVGTTAASGYEFYVHEGSKVNGPVRLLVAKDTGLPLRIEMTDPGGRGSMQMDYDFTPAGEIEVPECLAKGK